MNQLESRIIQLTFKLKMMKNVVYYKDKQIKDQIVRIESLRQENAKFADMRLNKETTNSLAEKTSRKAT